MPSKIKIILPLTLAALILASCSVQNTNRKPQIETDSQAQNPLEFKAAFAIFTDGTFRVFTNPMYHNRSEDVFIEAQNPNIIKVKKDGVTWNDFFKTLAMNLTADCLTAGTGQVFCTGEAGTLQFYVNGERVENFLERKITAGDKALITYGNQSQDEIADQIKRIPNLN